MIHLNDIEGAEAELKRIRKRFYGWMRDTEYLKKLIDEGKLSREDVKKKSFRNKDLGECELLAIAKASFGQYRIVTNDKGKVYQHPDQNLFDIYANDPSIILITGETWLGEIEYFAI